MFREKKNLRLDCDYDSRDIVDEKKKHIHVLFSFQIYILETKQREMRSWKSEKEKKRE